jgi:hypothetical protein
MDHTTFDALMMQFSFAEAGHLQSDNGILRYTFTDLPAGEGFVYLWVQSQDNAHTIVYVGMAGKTLKARCAQHCGGFRESTTGKAHAQRLHAGFADGCRYRLFARKCPTGTVVGEDAIPLASVEELAFIRKFKPAWNRLGQ